MGTVSTTATAPTNGNGRGRTARASEMLHDHLAERPYAVLGIAAGLGFAIGGGLRIAGRTLFGAAGRYLLGSFLRPALAGIGGGATDELTTHTPKRRRP